MILDVGDGFLQKLEYENASDLVGYPIAIIVPPCYRKNHDKIVKQTFRQALMLENDKNTTFTFSRRARQMYVLTGTGATEAVNLSVYIDTTKHRAVITLSTISPSRPSAPAGCPALQLRSSSVLNKHSDTDHSAHQTRHMRLMHQLRTPCQSALLASQWLQTCSEQMSGDCKESKDISEIVGTLNGAIQQILRVIDDDELSMGSMTRENNVTRILKEMVDVNLSLAKPNMIVSLAIMRNIPPLMIDRSAFRIVSQNIVENALKFTTIGNVVIRLRMEGGDLVMSVSDTGLGASVIGGKTCKLLTDGWANRHVRQQDELWTICDVPNPGKHSRVSSKCDSDVTTHVSTQSTGLGWKSIRTAIKIASCQVKVFSEIDVGTHIVAKFITAPVRNVRLKKRKKIQSDTSFSQENQSNQPDDHPTLLIVDDSVLTLKMMSRIVTTKFPQLNVMTAVSGKIALSMLKQQRFIAVITDNFMVPNGLTGIDLMRAIDKRASLQYLHRKVVLFSGNDVIVPQPKPACMFGQWRKPVTTDTLGEFLSGILSSSQ
jgi:CheY-like chemotaxis protein